jgi:hypothetical protein
MFLGIQEVDSPGAVTALIAEVGRLQKIEQCICHSFVFNPL